MAESRVGEGGAGTGGNAIVVRDEEAAKEPARDRLAAVGGEGVRSVCARFGDDGDGFEFFAGQEVCGCHQHVAMLIE